MGRGSGAATAGILHGSSDFRSSNPASLPSGHIASFDDGQRLPGLTHCRIVTCAGRVRVCARRVRTLVNSASYFPVPDLGHKAGRRKRRTAMALVSGWLDVRGGDCIGYPAKPQGHAIAAVRRPKPGRTNAPRDRQSPAKWGSSSAPTTLMSINVVSAATSSSGMSPPLKSSDNCRTGMNGRRWCGVTPCAARPLR